MANELKITVRFDLGNAKSGTQELGESIKKVAVDTKAFEGSIADLTQRLKILTDAQKQYKIGSDEFSIIGKRMSEIQTQLGGSVAKVGDVMSKVRPQLDGMAHGSANAAMTLQALNYTVRDSPYFFRDFSLGILAVGNNLNPLIDGMIRMKNESGSLFKGLVSAMSGTQGVVFAFSVLVSMLQAVTFALAKNKSQTADSKKGYDELTASVSDLSDVLQGLNKDAASMSFDEMERNLVKLQKKLYELRDEAPGIWEQIWQGLTLKPVTDFFNGLKIPLFDKTVSTKPIFDVFGITAMQNWFSGASDKTKKDIELVDAATAAIKEKYGVVKDILTNGVNLDKVEPEKLRQYTKYLDDLLGGWAKGVPKKELVARSFDLSEIINIGTFDRSKLESVKKQIDDYLKPSKETITHDADNIIDSMKDKALSAENELQRLKIANMKDGLDKEIAAIELKAKVQREEFQKTIRDEEQALEKARKDKKLPVGELAQAETVFKTTKTSLIDSITQTTVEEENAKTKVKEEYVKKAAQTQIEWDDKIAKLAANGIYDKFENKLADIEARYQTLFDQLEKRLAELNPEDRARLEPLLKGGLTAAKYGERAKAGFEHASTLTPDQKKDLKEEEKALQNINSAAGTMGNALANAFLKGGDAIQVATEALKQFIVQMLVVNAMKYLLTAIFMPSKLADFIFKFAQGGIVSKAQEGYVIPGTSYSGDKVPILANSGEMVLNEYQQRNLLKLLSAPVSGYNQMMMGRIDAMNTNMVSNQPTILIQSNVPGLEFTKKVINPAQAKLLKGNVVNVS